MIAGESSKYETLGVIGRGGMATVFIGRARGAGGFRRLVAIKRAHAHVRQGGPLAASMKYEATLAARLHHPNVVRVIDVIEEAEALVLVLDYIEGGSLTELLAGAALTDARARARVVVRILLDVAAGLDAAHRAFDENGAGLGIVHRDVSPSNVLVGTDGIARLTDFGIAKAVEEGPELTETGELKGKIAYMAPEYIERQDASPASDQYSLGVVAWEALTERRLFRGPTDIETLRRVLAGRVPSLATIEPALEAVEPVIARALARSTADRFGSVRELAEALEGAARAADLVASHAEVGQLVERSLRDVLAERRQLSQRTSGSVAPPPSKGGGRDDVATASHVGVPHAAVRARDPRARRPVIAVVLVALAVTLGGAVVAWRARPAPDEHDMASASSTSLPPSPPLPGEPPAGPDETSPAAPVASAPAPRPTTVPARAHPHSAGRRGAPSSGLVPRKAPPNPYVH